MNWPVSWPWQRRELRDRKQAALAAEITAEIAATERASGSPSRVSYAARMVREATAVFPAQVEAVPQVAALPEITGDDRVIARTQVLARITELTRALEYWRVVRVRNGNVLARFRKEEEARKYIEDNDYDTERVQVKFSPAPPEPEELTALKELDRQAARTIAAWSRPGTEVVLTSMDELGTEWAQRKCRARYGLLLGDLDTDWPFGLIDWNDAADVLLEGYVKVTYRGTDFYYIPELGRRCLTSSTTSSATAAWTRRSTRCSVPCTRPRSPAVPRGRPASSRSRPGSTTKTRKTTARRS